MGFIYGNSNEKGKYQGILLLLVRLAAEKTDLVISIVMPEMDEMDDPILENQVLGARYDKASAVMDRFRETFEIVDWSLLVNDEEGENVEG